MRVVIVGDGKVGYTLVEQLSREGHDLVVIDSSNKALQNSINTLDVIGIQGNGASYSVQMEAGVPKADLLIAATSADELNMLCCMLAKKLGARHTIARVRNPEYAGQLVLMKEELGLSMAINPELAAADEIARILRFPSAIKLETFAKGHVELVEIKIAPESPLNGQKLASLYHSYQVKVLVCAVQRAGEVHIPTGDFVLQAGDKINITASPTEIVSFFRAIGIFKQKSRSVMIIGGGRITHYLAKRLLEMGIQVKIIEINEERCRQLSEAFPKASIIHGDGTDEELLQEEGIADTDAFVALTDFDEENIVLSMYAREQAVKKVITKVNRLSFLGVLENAGIESTISPKHLTASQIVRYVRAMQHNAGSQIETLHKLVGGRVEALEFRVREKTFYLSTPLKDLNVRANSLIACITRKGRVIIPGGADTIETGDTVIVVTTDSGRRALGDFFE